MQSAILLSFVTSSSLPPCGLQSTHPPMLCYISPYVAYYVYEKSVLQTHVKLPKPILGYCIYSLFCTEFHILLNNMFQLVLHVFLGGYFYNSSKYLLHMCM